MTQDELQAFIERCEEDGRPAALKLAAKARERLANDEWLDEYENAHKMHSTPSRAAQQTSGFERLQTAVSESKELVPAPKKSKKKTPKWGLLWSKPEPTQKLPKAGSATMMER